MRKLLLLHLSLTVMACAGAPSESTESSEVALEPVVFSTCSLWSQGTGTDAECANINVPLDWSKPKGERANLFVKRVKGTAPGPHKQLWLLQGGPGASGRGFEGLSASFQALDPAIDLYIPDHRGTGRSTYLDCPSFAEGGTWDVEACRAELLARWGADGLATFSTTTAARDIGYAIEKTREPSQEVHVYGVSYGTLWAQRYLQIFPKQPTSVTLDSVCQTGLCSLLTYSYWTDRVAKKFLRECADDAYCASRLGPDPVAKAKEAILAVGAGTCPATAGIPAETVGLLLGQLAVNDFTREIVPPLVHRILRCNANDVAVLTRFKERMFPPPPPPSPSPPEPAPWQHQSRVLYYNIALSEMVEKPPISREKLQEMMSDALFAVYSPLAHEFYDAWPRYEHDEFVGKYPDTSVPILILNGTLDGPTPIEFAEEIASHYTRPHQTLVPIPRGSHGIFSSTRTTSGELCGQVLMKQFVASPTGPLDVSCADNIAPHSFRSNEPLAQSFFGVPDLWDDRVTDGPPANVDPRIEAAIAEVKEAIAGGVPSY